MRLSRPLSPLLVGALSMAVLVACSSDTDDGAVADRSTTTVTSEPAADKAANSVPIDGWAEATPDEVGLDGAVLDSLAASAEKQSSSCLLVVRHGKIAGEWYWGPGRVDAPQEVWSATKSYTSMLVGIAQADGDLKITDSASTWIPEWKGTSAEAVTVRDLLSNDSGRHWDFETDYTKLTGQADTTAFAIALGQDDPPATIWAYNNSAIQTLEQVLERSTGEQMADFGRERLLEPIGMDDSRFATDASGNAYAWMGLQSTCRDMARFGLLVLNHGAWGDDQIVPAEWVEAATTRSSQELNTSYGYLWWLNLVGTQASAVSPLRADEVASAERTQRVPGAPEDLRWALGLGGQIIQVHEPTDTVVVRLGPGVPSNTFGPAETARVVTEAITDAASGAESNGA